MHWNIRYETPFQIIYNLSSLHGSYIHPTMKRKTINQRSHVEYRAGAPCWASRRRRTPWACRCRPTRASGSPCRTSPSPLRPRRRRSRRRRPARSSSCPKSPRARTPSCRPVIEVNFHSRKKAMHSISFFVITPRPVYVGAVKVDFWPTKVPRF